MDKTPNETNIYRNIYFFLLTHLLDQLMQGNYTTVLTVVVMRFLTDSPQDGMKDCVLKDSYDNPSPKERTKQQKKSYNSKQESQREKAEIESEKEKEQGQQENKKKRR